MEKSSEKASTKVFKVLSCESGVRIFSLLGKRHKVCVSDISRAVGLSMSATSHQLQKMESAGLISSLRSGRTICYEFNESPMSQRLLECIVKPEMRSAKVGTAVKKR